MSAWQPIATAPRDGTRLLLYWKGHVVCGHWDEDRHVNRPCPYWSTDLEGIFRKTITRENPPTHWQPLPDAPESPR